MVTLLLALACTQEPARPPGGQTSDSADSGEPVTCNLGFDTEVLTWTLADVPGPLRALSDASCSEDGDEINLLEDLDGDRRPDLIRLLDCSRNSDLGDGVWKVHRNTGAGFAAEAIDWSLPETPEPYAFSSRQDGACENDPDHLFDLRDLDGDQRPELVVLSNCEGSTEPGFERWEVYKNTGDGFAVPAESWPVPAELAPDGWRTLEADRCGSFTRDVYALTDLTGDQAPDLVRTAGCTDQGVEGLGYWEVWRNLGDGFAETAEQWALPTDHGGDAWPGLAGGYCEHSTDHLYGTLDITGDDIPDLVVSSSCDEDPAWDERWRVYPGTGAGFSEAIDWSPPPTHVQGRWQRPFAAECTVASDLKTTLTDLTGDNLPDLVMLGACYGEMTPSSWEIYENLGDGFAVEPIDWWLPDDNEPLTWAVRTDTRCNNADDALLSIVDIDGDELPDVVETYGCDDTDGTGDTHWRVRLGGCLSQ
jgi:hypothetical protein